MSQVREDFYSPGGRKVHSIFIKQESRIHVVTEKAKTLSWAQNGKVFTCLPKALESFFSSHVSSKESFWTRLGLHLWQSRQTKMTARLYTTLYIPGHLSR